METKRLKALSSYNVLDTLPEKEYDAITRLASYICQVPVALISLIDSDRQWFKSIIGLDATQTSRADAFCNYTILNDEILEVTNAAEDEAFKDNPFVKGDSHIRFYAGAPLIDPEGNRLGSLCVIDMVPRKLTFEQRDALRTLADEVMSHFLLRKQKQELQQSLDAHKEFFNLFDTSPEIHFIADKDSNIELINKAVTAILGYNPQQAIGQSLWSFVVGNNREQYLPLIEKAKATGQSFDLETHTLDAAGQEKWIGWCGIYKGEKWYASGRDITYQKKILAELEELSLIAGKMVNGVAVSDANDKVIWINEAFEKLTGFNTADVEGRRLPDVFEPNINKENIKRYQDHINSKQSYSVHVYATRKDGRQVWLSITSSIIFDKDGGVEKYIRVISDITARKTAQKDLEILSFAARKSPSGMMSRDATGLVIWMNEAMEKITGYTLAEMEGKRFGTLLIGEQTDMEVFNDAINAVTEKRSYTAEILIYRKDRTPVWVAMSNSPLFNDAGDVERQVTTMLDITESKKTESELKLLSMVASNTTSGVVINNAQGEIEWVNDAFEKITGFDIDDVRNTHLGDVLQGELTDVSIIQKGRELSKNKQSFEVDLLGYRKDGTPMWITVINSVILNREGAVDKYIEVVIDISAKKKVELELIDAREEALQLSRAKDMFISVMSHEIRTPLNAVIGMSHLLLEGNPLESQKENLNVLKFSADNLLNLINDVLDFTKIETGNIELEQESINLRQMVQSITGSLQYKTKEKNIYLDAQVDPAVPEIVVGDVTRLSQILLNLVNNAVKFTDRGGVKIELAVIDQTRKNVRIRFSVTDTGIGIANDKLYTIFESFKQADKSTTRKYGGTGLGLAISKRLIELHDSRINVDSEPGKGSTFWFTITFNKANDKKNKSNTVETTLNISVLVVDDNQINRLLINKILTKWGATVDFAENGILAVNKVEANKYDVVLMDIHMPEMGGLEATQIIRSKPEPYFKQLPIVALTASMLTSQMGDIGNAGMNDYILKPFEPKVLFEKLSRFQKQ
ncbi:PAS domain-containing protein [Mucilaginibacter sp. UR6-11]|uniref:PAS domain-containing protein n=1 Tax=Mucilaginibacter sp. UR6-11 TaxID=1435644 RepID=UPI001E34A846|nr:PAS domain-containing protein [Mucilaginibacter sp. UR6-11]MCC8425234.1 PAS domain S-box protein [Mucilaginibacter sp. UR6-11]